MSYFIYNGQKSSDFGLRIESKDVFSSPDLNRSMLSIPGRDGEIIAQDTRFSNLQITYQVFLRAKNASDLSSKMRDVKNWLYQDLNRYNRLEDYYNPRFYRKAVINNKLNIDDIRNKLGTFTVSFSALPFQYSIGGDQEILLQSGTAITNPYHFVAKPYLKVYGTGGGSFTIASESETKTWHVMNINQFMEIDSELMLCYKGSVSQNLNLIGDGFPLLHAGKNRITFDGGITSISIIPRWCSL